MWWMYAFLSALFAALTAVLAKVGIKNIDSDLGTAVRTVVILVLAWGFVLFKGNSQSFALLTRQNVVFLVLSGIATGLSWIFYFRALQLGTVAQVASIDKLSVALAIVFSIAFLGEALTLKTAIGATLIIAGTLVIVL